MKNDPHIIVNNYPSLFITHTITYEISWQDEI